MELFFAFLRGVRGRSLRKFFEIFSFLTREGPGGEAHWNILGFFSFLTREGGGATENFSWFFSDFWCLKKIEGDQKKFFSWRHFITALYTFQQKSSSFKFLSILEEKCVAHINIGTFKRKFLLTNVSKNGRWVNYTFLQKLSSFKFYGILDENCAANIINGRLLLTIAAKIVFGWVTLSCKSLLQWVACWEDRLPWVACCEKQIAVSCMMRKQIAVSCMLRTSK